MAKFVPLSDEERAAAPSGPRFTPVPPPARVPIPTGAPPGQVMEGPPGTRLAQPRTFTEGVQHVAGGVRGAGEAALSMGTGMVAAPVGLLAGAQEAAGGEGLQKTIEATRGAQDKLTFKPRTPQGQRLMQVLSMPFQFLEGVPEAIGEGAAELTRSEGAGAAAFLGAEALPALLGSRFRPGGRTRAEAGADIKRAEGQASELGVDLRAGVTPQTQQIGEAGARLAPGERGSSISDVVARMKELEEQTRTAKDRLFAEARINHAAVPTDLAVKEFLPALRRGLATFNLDDLPVTRRMLAKAEAIEDLPAGSGVTINAMEEWRKSINTRMPKGDTNRGRQERAALDAMKDELEQWLDAKLDADMISGSPKAVQEWKDARRAQQSYGERFRDNKVINNLIKSEAEVAEVRNWIFGASAANAKKEANGVVTKLKNELGADSPEFTALRADAALDIVEPLLREGGPDLKGFIRKYDNMVRHNPQLARTLFDENLTGLKQLRDIAQANRNRPVAVVSELPGASNVLAVSILGHQLAKGALRRRVGETAINSMTRVATAGVRRKMLADILGYDAAAPFFGKRNIAALGVGTTLMEGARAEDEPEEPTPTYQFLDRSTPGGP